MTPDSPSRWSTAKRSLSLDATPLVMGIVNVTPDSFSDGGKFADIDAAVRHGLQLHRDGADILDVGGESTRPGSDPVDADTQIHRVVDVIAELSRQCDAAISVDTASAKVAEAAVDAGAEIINDVTGMQSDPAMVSVASATNAGVCAMHMRGTPKTMQNDLHYDDVVEEILDYLRRRRDDLLSRGIRHEKICLDPGIGFGKSHEQNRELMRSAARFLETGCPILVGHSRKGFIGKTVGDEIEMRDAGTLGGTLALAAAGIHIVRVHEVRRTVAALQVFRQSLPASK